VSWTVESLSANYMLQVLTICVSRGRVMMTLNTSPCDVATRSSLNYGRIRSLVLCLRRKAVDALDLVSSPIAPTLLHYDLNKAPHMFHNRVMECIPKAI